MRWVTGTIIGVALFFIACSGGEEAEPAHPGDAVTGPSAATNGLAEGAVPPFEASPGTLPTQAVAFSVEMPAGTVPPVRLRTVGLHQFETIHEAALEQTGPTTWGATIDLEVGSLVRYRYERTDEYDLDAINGRVEAAHADLEFTWRLLAMTPDRTSVRDTVAMWADARVAEPIGEVRGVVTEVGSGTALHNVEVSAGGIHSATGVEGEFVIPGLAPGEHTLTLHRADGSVRARSLPVTVTAGAATLVEPALELAAPVDVTFRVAIPADSPAGAQVSLFGTAEQLGGWFYQAPNQTESLLQPVIGPAEGEATYRVTLHEGQHVLYRYNLGLVSLNGERSRSGMVYRHLVVRAAEPEQRDVIEAWRGDDQVFTTVQVSVPDDSPAGPAPLIAMGPQHPLTPRGDGTYQFTFVGWPGNRFEFGYRLGELADTANEVRTVTSGDRDTVVEHTVRRWEGTRGQQALSAGESTEVLIRLSVSADDEDETYTLSGEPPISGVALQARADNPSLLEGRVTLPAGEWMLGVDGCPNLSGADEAGNLVLTVDLERPVFDLWSVSCNGAAVLAPRERPYVAGIYTPDLFSPEMPRLTESTYQAIEDAGGTAVALSSVMAYGQTLPQPTLERRPIFASSVATPTWALRAQAAIAEEHDLATFLAPQFNFELTPGGSEGLTGTRDATWWTPWIEMARGVWLEHAVLASELDAELLLLPGPFFHAFGPSSDFADEATLEAFNTEMAALIDEVRARYDGQLVIAGDARHHRFIADVDIAGVTGFGLQHPELGPTATLAEWESAYEEQFRARIDPVRAQWGNPVMFYQLHIPASATADDPTGEYGQAKQLEALMRAIERRPWIVGSFSWSWTMTEGPETPGDGLRGRLGEAVQAKFFERFAAANP